MLLSSPSLRKLQVLEALCQDLGTKTKYVSLIVSRYHRGTLILSLKREPVYQMDVSLTNDLSRTQSRTQNELSVKDYK